MLYVGLLQCTRYREQPKGRERENKIETMKRGIGGEGRIVKATNKSRDCIPCFSMKVIHSIISSLHHSISHSVSQVTPFPQPLRSINQGNHFLSQVRKASLAAKKQSQYNFCE